MSKGLTVLRDGADRVTVANGAADGRDPSESSRFVLLAWGVAGLVAAALLGVVVASHAWDTAASGCEDFIGRLS